MDCEVLIYEIILQRRATNLLGHKNIPKYSEIGKKTEMFSKPPFTTRGYFKPPAT